MTLLYLSCFQQNYIYQCRQKTRSTCSPECGTCTPSTVQPQRWSWKGLQQVDEGTYWTMRYVSNKKPSEKCKTNVMRSVIYCTWIINIICNGNYKIVAPPGCTVLSSWFSYSVCCSPGKLFLSVQQFWFANHVWWRGAVMTQICKYKTLVFPLKTLFQPWVLYKKSRMNHSESHWI